MNNNDKYSEDRDESPDSSILRSIGNKNPFTVPSHYFDQLPYDIAEKCLREKKHSWTGAVLSLFARPRLIGAAAILLILITVGVYKYRMPSGNNIAGIEIDYSEYAWMFPEDIIIENCIASGIGAESNQSGSFENQAEEFLINNKLETNFIINEL